MRPPPPATGGLTSSTPDPIRQPPHREIYTIPSSSSWFKWDEIHETERQELPEFFGGGSRFVSVSRNPRIYKEYRDFIINKYREDPSRKLRFTEIRKAVAADVTLLRKLFFALEKWGLINFSSPLTDSTGEEEEEQGRLLVVVEEVDPGVKVVVNGGEKKNGAVGVMGLGGNNGYQLPPLASYSDVFGEWAPREKGSVVCGVCGEWCGGGEVEALEDGFKVCCRCSRTNNNKKTEAAESLSDKKEVNGNRASSAWTDAETLLLLEGALKHSDDWDLIAQHVHTRNKFECISRLIQLPFGDHMLHTINGKHDDRHPSNHTNIMKSNQYTVRELSSLPTETEGGTEVDGNENVKEKSIDERPSKRRHIFSSLDSTESLMEQIVLLSTVAGPHVAAAAADAAITALGNENLCAREVFDVNGNGTLDNETLDKSFSSNNNSKSDPNVGDQDMKMNEQTDAPVHSPSVKFISIANRVRAAVATAMGAAAARAKLLADQEEKEIELLMASIIEAQLRKIQYKIKHFEELEFLMEQEYGLIQQLKKSLVDEWSKVLQQAFQDGVPRIWDDTLPKPQQNKNTP